MNIHETAIIENNVIIGEGTKIWHFSHIREYAQIGKNCIIGKYIEIGPVVKIGDRCKIQNHANIFEGSVLEDYVFIGPGVIITNVSNPRAESKSEFTNTLIKHHATIGANSTIICGLSIGEYAFIGAGSVVTKDIPPYALAYGNPARIVGKVNEKGVRI